MIEVRRIALAQSMTLTYDLALQSPAIKIKVTGQLVQKIEWKQKDRKSDGGKCIMRLNSYHRNKLIVKLGANENTYLSLVC